jgi:hypothetical protein
VEGFFTAAALAFAFIGYQATLKNFFLIR